MEKSIILQVVDDYEDYRQMRGMKSLFVCSTQDKDNASAIIPKKSQPLSFLGVTLFVSS